MKIKIAELLIGLNKSLDTPVVDMTDSEIHLYAKKLVNNAKILTVSNGEVLEAFIAFYDNDNTKERAYLSMLAVSYIALGKGYGKILMAAAIQVLEHQKFTYFDIVVDTNNKIALDFALHFGFKETEVDDKVFYRKQL